VVALLAGPLPESLVVNAEEQREIEKELVDARRRLAHIDSLHELSTSQSRTWRRMEDAIRHAIEDGDCEAARYAIADFERWGRKRLGPQDERKP
jgi:hypothetical protein